jgi:hypothetical protein
LEQYSQEPQITQSEADEDPLLDLFRNKTYLSTMDFLNELRKQRRSNPVEQSENTW